jgi:hypothetical protein
VISSSLLYFSISLPPPPSGGPEDSYPGGGVAIVWLYKGPGWCAFHKNTALVTSIREKEAVHIFS